MQKIFMASVLILAVALPVKAQTGPGLGETDYRGSLVSDSYTGERYARVCTGDQDGRLSMRMGPGAQYNKTKEIPNGHYLGLVDGEYGRDGFYWWQVMYNGNRGWVRSDYVCGDPQ
jgi:hypothetical protein